MKSLSKGGLQTSATKLKKSPIIFNPCICVSPGAALLSTFATGTAGVTTKVGWGVGGAGVGDGVGNGVGLGVGTGVGHKHGTLP